MYKLNPFLREFWRTRKPYKLLKGGRFSSKTQDAAGMAAYLARNYSIRFLCVRQFQNKIAESVYTVIKDKIEAAGWTDEFDIGVSTIRHRTTGSEFLFYGMARNIEEIKGTENIDICWIEEGEGLTESQWAIIDPTIRKQGSEVWILWNPRLASDFVQAKLPALLGEDCVIKHINYDQNPFLSDTAKAKAERLKRVDEDAYRHIYLGEPLTDDDQVIIKRSWIDAAIDAHKKLGFNDEGPSIVGYDVADDGEDLNATCHSKGSVVYDTDKWKGGEDKLMQSTSRAYNKCRESESSLVYDSIGVGAGVGSKVNELNESNDTRIIHQGFNAGGKVAFPEQFYNSDAKIKNKDYFANVKAQSWWLVADRFRNTYEAIMDGKKFDVDDMISIDSGCRNLQELCAELSTPQRHFDKNGRVKVESKDDLRRREIKSPNLADAFIMCYAPIHEAQTPSVYVPSRKR